MTRSVASAMPMRIARCGRAVSARAWPDRLHRVSLHRVALLVVAALALAACATSTRPAAGDRTSDDLLMLVSIDAFRADYLDRGITPNLSRIAREGVRARWMTSSYPSLTFPNHWAIVTGLRPDRSGLVHNTMRDPRLGGFKVGDATAVGDARWWGGEPIWAGAEKAGIRSGTMFWPGSQAPVGGVRPSHWLPYDESLPAMQRVDTLLGWLDAPATKRPRVLTLYFDQVDEQGHDHGPDSPEVEQALRDTDAAIGRLVAGLEARALLARTNLLVVSDHGMATVKPDHVIAVEDLVSVQEAVVVSVGQVIGIAPNPGFESVVAARLLGAHDHYDCWRKEAMPARWHYGHHPRVPPIVCQMHEGWDALARETVAKRPKHSDRGSHGYDPALPSMRALFIARGPAFRSGTTLAPFDNVDVYPLLARLAGIAAAPNDGDIAPLLPALRDDATR